MKKLFVEELESRIAPVMPPAEAWCAGVGNRNPNLAGIRFIQDPCNTIDHPMGPLCPPLTVTTMAIGEEVGPGLS